MRTLAAKLFSIAAIFVLVGGACGGDGDADHDDHDHDQGTQESAQAEAGKSSTAGASGHSGTSGASGSSAGSGGSTAGSKAMGPAAPMMDDGAATFTNVYYFTFTLTTCRAQTCHGGGLAGLNLANYDAAYASLVDQDANPMGQCGALGKKRVVPNDPENSLLFLKLFGESAPCGQQMPPGGQLADKQIQRVKDWISMGAKKD